MKRHTKRYSKPVQIILYLIGSLFLTFLSAGCHTFNYVIRIQDSNTLSNISNAEVSLEVSGLPPLIQYSDNEGIVIMPIDSERVGQIGKIVVSAEGYKNYTRNFEIRDGELPDLFRLEPENSSQESVAIINDTELPNEATSTPTRGPELITPTLMATVPRAIATYDPTEIPTPTSLPTATSTAAQQPTLVTPTIQVTLTRREGANIVYVLAGPDVSNVQLGTLAVNETAEVIGRTRQNEWLLVITDRGVQGWVANCEVTLSSSDLSSVTITWTGLVTPKNCGDTD